MAGNVSTVVFGKLADLYGRRSVLLVGIGICGSLLCGFAWSMPSLIAFRLIQGIGAGAIQPVSINVIGDLYPAHERGRVQGWLASVWGVPFVILTPTMSPLVAGFGSLVMGFGMGFLSTAAIVLIQDSVGWAERGAAIASKPFARNLGSTLGATVLGVVLNASLMQGHAGSLQKVQRLLDHHGAAIDTAATRAALAHGLHVTFWGVLLIAAATLALSAFVPRVKFTPEAAA